MSRGVDVLNALKSIDWRLVGASLVLVHGSALQRSNPRDVDLIVVPSEGIDPEDLAMKVMEIVENVLGLEADVYVLTDPSDANCFLVLEAFGKGIVLHQDPYGREVWVKAVNICNDFMLSRRSVRYTETLIEKVMSSAPRKASRRHS